MEVTFSTVFCEDIRREFDGRHMLLGVYPGIIFVGHSATVQVSNHIYITGLEPGQYSFKLKAVFENDDSEYPISTVEFQMPVETHYPVALTPTNMKLDGSNGNGVLKLLATIGDQPELEVGRISLEVVDDDEDEDEDTLQ